MTASRQRLGRIAERMAARELERAGLEVVERNWRCATAHLRGELDLVARDGTTVVFCEVKARRGDPVEPLEAVTPRKLAQLRRLAAAWLAEQDTPAVAIRIDVVGVSWPSRGGRAVLVHLVDVG